MKGYFSQLARHTGLNFESGRPPVTPAGSAPRTAFSQQSVGREPQPLHVEEVTFTDASGPIIHDTSVKRDEGSAQIRIEPISEKVDESKTAPPAHNAHPGQSEFRDPLWEYEAKVPDTSIKISSVAEFKETATRVSGTRSVADEFSKRIPNEQSVEIEQRAIEQQVEWTTQPSTAGLAEVFERPVQLEGQFEFSEHSALNAPDQNQQPRQQGREQQTEKGESTDSEPQRQREAIVRNYLKEVREWISTPLEDSESETAFEVRADTPSKNSDASGWPEYQTNEPRSSPHEQPQTQDLNLSIGTISVVIEEPAKQPTVPQVVPAPAERIVERTTGGSTDLSRYYLRTW